MPLVVVVDADDELADVDELADELQAATARPAIGRPASAAIVTMVCLMMSPRLVLALPPGEGRPYHPPGVNAGVDDPDAPSARLSRLVDFLLCWVGSSGRSPRPGKVMVVRQRNQQAFGMISILGRLITAARER